MNNQQLLLPISLPQSETFSSFYTGDNELLVDNLNSFLQQSNFGSFYFWSLESAGKTHLLYASCNFLSVKNKKIIYIPLDKFKLFTTDILLGIDDYDLICIDNIDSINDDYKWQVALFDLFNRLSENNKTKLLITGNAPPNHLNFKLKDLISRLQWGVIYQIKILSDQDKLKILQLKANLRGFDLPTNVGLYLLKRVDRDINFLSKILEKLDNITLTEKRKLTIPLIKTALNL